MKSIGSLGLSGQHPGLWSVGASLPVLAVATAITLALAAGTAHAEPAYGNATAAPQPNTPQPSRATPLPSTTGALTAARSSSPTPLAAFAQAATPAPAATPTVDFGGESASPEAREMARVAFERRDARGRPFAVVDKKEAKLFVFSAEGRLVGAAPALLGLARGDTAAPGVGQMVAAGIPPALRTTPSGRYDSQPGPNLRGETVIWVDYDAAFAIHRLRPAPASERRAERLASASPDDNRISLGCVVVAGDFFDRVVTPVLGRGPGVIYVLPEPKPAAVAQGAGSARL